MHILITCEHATNFIPRIYQDYFANKNNLLNSHAAIDLNARECAEYLYNKLKKHFDCSIYLANISRLLIDHNRSLSNPNCWSKISKEFSKKEQKLLIEQYYNPYRKTVLDTIQNLQNEQILHLSMHSFTPILNNEIRNNDLGILYDSRRKNEANFAIQLQHIVSKNYNVRRNYPYLGKSDGLTATLRKLYSEKKYLGFEIELNQKIQNWQPVMQDLVSALLEILL